MEKGNDNSKIKLKEKTKYIKKLTKTKEIIEAVNNNREKRKKSSNLKKDIKSFKKKTAN